MKIGYLINQYPKVSHSFVRREINMLERQGMVVRRWAIRGWRDELADEKDLVEREITTYILKAGGHNLLLAGFIRATKGPKRFLRSLILTLKVANKSDRAIWLHFVSFFEAAYLANQMLREGVQHLHAHFGMNSTEVAMIAASLSGIPYSFTVHGPDEFDKPEFSKLSLKVKEAKFVAAISFYCASQIFRWSDLNDWHKVKIVKCGLDPAYFDTVARDQVSNCRFVCVARLSAQKGHYLLIEAIYRLVPIYPNIELVLIGDGELRDKIERLINKYRIGANVRIVGWKNEESVRSFLTGARALILPSFAEGLPVVIMEAMALGRPVLATNIAAVSELVVENETGWLFAPGSVERICGAVVACIEAPLAERASMGEKALALVRVRHDVSTEVAKLAQFFVEMD